MIDEERLQEVWITTQDGIRWPIIAEVHDGLAIHHTPLIYPDGVDFLTTKSWTITHVQSGISFGNYPNEERARKALAKYLAVKLDGIGLGAMPGCELCANALVIAPLVRSRMSSDELLRKASFAAEVLACTPKPEEEPAP